MLKMDEANQAFMSHRIPECSSVVGLKSNQFEVVLDCSVYMNVKRYTL